MFVYGRVFNLYSVTYRAAYITLQRYCRSAVGQATTCLFDASVFMKSRNCCVHLLLCRAEGLQKQKMHVIETCIAL